MTFINVSKRSPFSLPGSSENNPSPSNLSLKLKRSIPGNIPLSSATTSFPECGDQKWGHSNVVYSCSKKFQLLYSVPMPVKISKQNAVFTTLFHCVAIFRGAMNSKIPLYINTSKVSAAYRMLSTWYLRTSLIALHLSGLNSNCHTSARICNLFCAPLHTWAAILAIYSSTKPCVVCDQLIRSHTISVSWYIFLKSIILPERNGFLFTKGAIILIVFLSYPSAINAFHALLHFT